MVARLSSFFNDVLGTALTGLSTATNAAISATDSVLSALGKLQAQVSTKSNINSPAFLGTPTAPTPATSDNSTSISTTAFVKNQNYLTSASVPAASTTTPAMNGTAAVGTSTTYARGDHVHPTDTSLAPLASPAFTGMPTAPTQTYGDNSTRLASTAFVAAAVPFGLFKNRIHNPGHEVQQRSTSTSLATGSNGLYMSDRWVVAGNNTSGSMNASILSGSFGPCRYYLGNNAAVAANGYCLHQQRLESADVFDLAGQIVTLSLYCSASGTGTLTGALGVAYPAAKDNFTNNSNWTSIVNQAIAITGTVTRFSVTFTMPSSVSNGIVITLQANESAAGTLSLYSAGMQLEIGSNVSAFERRPIEVELALCQRYYQSGGGTAGGYSTGSGQTLFFPLTIPPMRVAPTVGASGAGGSGYSAVASYNVGINNITIQATTNAAGQVAFNYAYTASADL